MNRQNEPTAAKVIEILGLVPLPQEGGHWSQVLLDGQSSAIYYLLNEGEFSALHRLPHPEVYHHYAGAPLELLVLHPDGRSEQPLLGTDLAGGHRPAIVVPAGAWQGSRPLGSWSLVGTTMAPPFTFNDFELGQRDQLCRLFPRRSGAIEGLTHPN